MSGKIKDKLKEKKLYNIGGGKGGRDTNEDSIETKGDKKRTKKNSTNLKTKDFFHEQN